MERVRLCRAGLTNLCPNRKLVGIHSPGGFAEYTLAPASNVYPLPEGVEARTGALAEPLANGVHAARLGLAGRSVEHAVVIGAGTIGLMCLQAAVLDGVPEVHAVEPVEGRREQALALGADAAHASGEEARGALDAPTEGLGVDLVIDAVGAEATRRMALDLLRPGGRAVYIGLHDDDTTLGFHDVVRGQLDLQGSYALHGGGLRAGAGVAGRWQGRHRGVAARVAAGGGTGGVRRAGARSVGADQNLPRGGGVVEGANLSGKTALVIGASSGIGLATANLFADAGARGSRRGPP